MRAPRDLNEVIDNVIKEIPVEQTRFIEKLEEAKRIYTTVPEPLQFMVWRATSIIFAEEIGDVFDEDWKKNVFRVWQGPEYDEATKPY